MMTNRKNINIKNEIVMHTEIIRAIDIHRKAVELVFI